MSSLGSVTHWIDLLKAGDHAAAQKLWERYFERLVRRVRKQLRDTPRRASDEEDGALSAFNSFCRGAEQGRFPQLSDRDNLWPLLVRIAVHKASDLGKHERRKKRGGGAVHVSCPAADSESDDLLLAQIVSREPTPELAVEVADQCEHLLSILDEEMRQVALWKMEGYTNDEIAAKLGCVRRTVERRISVIRSIWGKKVSEP